MDSRYLPNPTSSQPGHGLSTLKEPPMWTRTLAGLAMLICGLMQPKTARADTSDPVAAEQRELLLSTLQDIKHDKLRRRRIYGSSLIVGGGASFGYGKYLQANPTSIPCDAIIPCVVGGLVPDLEVLGYTVTGASAAVGGLTLLPDIWNPQYNRQIESLESDGSVERAEFFLEMRADRARFHRIAYSGTLFAYGTIFLVVSEGAIVLPSLALFSLGGLHLGLRSPDEIGWERFKNRAPIDPDARSGLSIGVPSIVIGDDGSTQLQINGSF